MSILNFRLNIILPLFFWSQAIPILAAMLGTSHSADDEVGITVQWLPSGDAKMTVDTMVYPHLSNTLQGAEHGAWGTWTDPRTSTGTRRVCRNPSGCADEPSSCATHRLRWWRRDTGQLVPLRNSLHYSMEWFCLRWKQVTAIPWQKDVSALQQLHQWSHGHC